MFNNPMQMIMQAFAGGGNPMQMLAGMAQRDKRVAMGMQMIGGKSPDQIRQMAQNMARERGVNVQDIINSLGIRR